MGVSLAEDYKVQASFKFGRDDMFNLRGDSVQEVSDQAAELADRLPVIIAVIQGIQTELSAAMVQATFPDAERITEDTSQPRDNVDRCAHGAPWERRSGKKQNGKPWSGKFCTVKNDPKLKQCETIFDN